MASSAHDAKEQLRKVMWGLPQTPQYKMLVVGQVSSGKTCFLNFLSNIHAVLGSKPAEEAIRSLQSCARGSDSRTACATFNDVSIEGVTIQIIDTPGFVDIEDVPDVLNHGKEHEQQIREALRTAQYVNCIVFVVNGSQERLVPAMRSTLEFIASLMPNQILSQVVLLFTHVDSAQRRAFPVPALREFLNSDPVCIHLDNPLGRFAGLSEFQLKQSTPSQSGDDESEEAEIKKAISRGIGAVTELLTVARELKPVRVPPRQGLGSVPVWAWIALAGVLTLLLLGRRRAFLMIVLCLLGLFWRGGGFSGRETRNLQGSLLEMESLSPEVE